MVEECSLFVKLSPESKARIIQILKENGHTVAYMGDGINDTPAMKKADVAISVDTAVDIAKKSADIILLHKSLLILEHGVRIGRQIFANTMKYIKITLSSNFGNILSILVASSFLPFLPMLPMQLLILDLIYGTSCLSLPFDRVGENTWKYHVSGRQRSCLSSCSSLVRHLQSLMSLRLPCFTSGFVQVLWAQVMWLLLQGKRLSLWPSSGVAGSSNHSGHRKWLSKHCVIQQFHSCNSTLQA